MTNEHVTAYQEFINKFVETMTQEYTLSYIDETTAAFYFRYAHGDLRRAIYECLLTSGEEETAIRHFPAWAEEDGLTQAAEG